MSDMVERVAKAIAAADCEWQDTPGAQIMGWSERLARAAITAMYEPTEAMCKAAWEDPDSDGAGEDAAAIWCAMVDEAQR